MLGINHLVYLQRLHFSQYYRIYSAIRRGFPRSRISTNNQIRPMQFCCNTRFTLPPYKMDLEFWDCFGSKKKHRLISKEIRYK